jgi:hypothetical protein
MATAPRKNSSNIVSRRILVLVKRDMTDVTPRVIWEHEKPILEAIFGEGQVTDVDPATMDDGYTPKVSPDMLVHNKRQDPIKRPSEVAGIGYAFSGDVRGEYERLANCYGKHTERDILNVEHVYGRFQDGKFERVVGSAQHEDMPDAQLRAIVIANGYLPMVSKESTDAEKREASDVRQRLNDMPREQLVKLADELVGEYA